MTVNHRRLGYDGNRESVNLTDTLVTTVGVGVNRQTLQVDTHILFIGKPAGVDGEVVYRVAVLVTLYHSLVTGIIGFHLRNRRLVVGYVVGNHLQL